MSRLVTNLLSNRSGLGRLVRRPGTLLPARPRLPRLIIGLLLVPIILWAGIRSRSHGDGCPRAPPVLGDSRSGSFASFDPRWCCSWSTYGDSTGSPWMRSAGSGTKTRPYVKWTTSRTRSGRSSRTSGGPRVGLARGARDGLAPGAGADGPGESRVARAGRESQRLRPLTVPRCMDRLSVRYVKVLPPDLHTHMANVLIVDDEEMDRLLQSRIIEQAGHTPFFAGDGAGCHADV